MADVTANGMPTVLLSGHQIFAYNDNLPGWGGRILEKLGAGQIDCDGHLVIFTEDGREMEFMECGHA